MSEFDAYLKWLAIPPEYQPPNHYRLLGVPEFMDDSDVIQNAADRQMAHIRNFATGKNGPLSQQILNEISLARICLLNAEKKAEYDKNLKAQSTTLHTTPAIPAVAQPTQPREVEFARPLESGSPKIIAADSHRDARRAKANQGWAWQQVAVMVGGFAVVCGVISVMMFLAMSNREAKDPPEVAGGGQVTQHDSTSPHSVVGSSQSPNTAKSTLGVHAPPLNQTDFNKSKTSIKTKDWITLFDGTDMAQWEELGAFQLRNGELVATHGELAKSKAPFGDFELEFEWRISEGGNGGVYYRERETGLTVQNWFGTEYQLLDNVGHRNGKDRLTCAGSLYGCIAPETDVTRPIGEFNTSRIICRGSNVEHWMNGKRLLAYDLDSEVFQQARTRVKSPGIRQHVGAKRCGHIYLQSDRGEIAFRNIRIRAN